MDNHKGFWAFVAFVLACLGFGYAYKTQPKFKTWVDKNAEPVIKPVATWIKTAATAGKEAMKKEDVKTEETSK